MSRHRDPAGPGPAESPGRPALGALMILGAAALWGSLGLFGRLIFHHGASPLDVASVRAALAFAALLPLVVLRPRRFAVRLADLPLVLGYGAIGIAFFYWVYLEAVRLLPLAVAAALLYTAPAFVLAIAWTLRWEPVQTRRLLPLAMVMAGAFLVTGAFRALDQVHGAGVLAGLLSGLAYAIYTAVGKRIRRRYDVLPTIVFAYGTGALLLAVARPPWLVFLRYPDAAPTLLLMGLGPTLLAAILFYGGLRHIEASAASMLATIEPAVAAGLGLLWFGERLAPSTLAGTALIVAAALLLRPAGARGPPPARSEP